MAFDISTLSLIAHGNNLKVYTYTSSDSKATIMASGYFGKDASSGQQSSNMLDAGDIVMVEASDGHFNARVDTISGTTVTMEMGAGETQWLTVPIMNIATSGSVFIPAPFDGALGRMKIATNGETLDVGEVHVNLAGVLVTGLSISLDQSGQGAGEVYSTVATGANTVSEGDAIQVQWDGGASSQMHATEVDCIVAIEVLPV